MFPSVASLERLTGAVTREQDDPWAGSRYFSEARMREPYEAKAAADKDERSGGGAAGVREAGDRVEPGACGQGRSGIV